MGEAFKRLRAKSFKHQRHHAYQRLIDHDLLKLARSNDVTREITGRRSDAGSDLEPGTPCFIRNGSAGDYDVVHGNVVIAKVPPEARDVIDSCSVAAPSLQGVIPCRVVRVGKFGAVSLVVDPKVLNDE